MGERAMTIKEILKLEFAGNHYHDALKFDAILNFAKDPANSEADRIAAADHMSDKGMGMGRVKTAKQLRQFFGEV
jgi:hypothetical protein